jgi:hypothetical protein
MRVCYPAGSVALQYVAVICKWFTRCSQHCVPAIHTMCLQVSRVVDEFRRDHLKELQQLSAAGGTSLGYGFNAISSPVGAGPKGPPSAAAAAAAKKSAGRCLFCGLSAMVLHACGRDGERPASWAGLVLAPHLLQGACLLDRVMALAVLTVLVSNVLHTWD